MKTRSIRLAVETLEDRCVPSTVAYADFNKDGYVDMAAVTSPTTITVSLAKPDGSYAVSAILTAPKSLPIDYVNVGDYNGDGNLDISGGGFKDRFYTHTWLGDGDGTFEARDTWKGAHFSKWNF
jgi:VCBS repeat protein